MRIVEDKDGERFLVIESDEDFEKFKEDLLKTAREKAKDRARKPSYETQSPK
jgi:chloramphenicol O-acetyltransferase